MLDQHTRATMTVEEAARIVGISRSAAYRAVATGQLPSIRVGRRLLVPTAKLDQLLGRPVRPMTDVV